MYVKFFRKVGDVMKMKVSEIMTPNPICAKVPGTKRDVLRLLVKHNITGVPVVNEEEYLVGIVSRRDIFEHPEEEQLALLMRKDVPVVNVEDGVEDAARIMKRYGRRHLVVVDENKKVLGVITPQDFLDVIIKRKISEPVENFITKPCFPLHICTPLPVVFRAMSLTLLSAFPVVDDDGKLVGIVTDRDLFEKATVDMNVAISELGLGDDEDSWNWEGLRNVMKLFYMEEKVNLPKIPVEEVMIRDPITIFSKSPIWEAARIMKKNNFSQLPVRNTHDELIAMIFDSDLVLSLTGAEYE
mgnify:CR=1 FL=1